MAGPNDPEDFFQTKWFCNSVCWRQRWYLCWASCMCSLQCKPRLDHAGLCPAGARRGRLDPDLTCWALSHGHGVRILLSPEPWLSPTSQCMVAAVGESKGREWGQEDSCKSPLGGLFLWFETVSQSSVSKMCWLEQKSGVSGRITSRIAGGGKHSGWPQVRKSLLECCYCKGISELL